ncbi:MAG: hypothetical protein KIH63_001220 [Candidatus Saccharibacteria bacterium]|nr:hypothetical protein [Candidatus Saccharibacteria bacterium]
MKQKDWTLIAVIAIVAGLVAFFVSNMLIASPKNRQQKVEVVDAITEQFTEPSKKYFNESSVDPTSLIRIGDNANLTPFGSQ